MSVVKQKPTFHHTRAKERILAPDVARGFMLLGIAVANAVTAWAALGSGSAGETRTLPTDGFVTVLNAVFVHVRGLPMFATLFGYGIGMLVMREHRRGTSWPAARGLLLKRYGWLALFGVVHSIVLFYGDILLLYAVLGLLVSLLVPLRNKTLLWIAGILAGIYVVMLAVVYVVLLATDQAFDVSAGPAAGGPYDVAAMLGGGYVGNQLVVGVSTVVMTPLTMLLAGPQLMPLMLVGLVAARVRILEEAARHQKLLVIVAVVGAGAAVATGVPAGLADFGYIDGDGAEFLSEAAGLLAGPGLIAVIALSCIPVQRRIRAAAERGETLVPPWPLAMLQALGQRSMSGYVAQSVLFGVLATSWMLDLFDGESTTIICLWATGVWAVTVVAAWLLAKAGKAGPLEALHRRLTYGRGG